MKKLSTLMMIVLLVITGTNVFADEEVSGETGAEIEVNGIVGEFDPTKPGPNPTDPNKWIKVSIPTTILFYSEEDNLATLASPEYSIQNLSAKIVEVKVSGIENISDMERVTSLQINDINLFSNGNPVVTGSPILFTLNGVSGSDVVKKSFELTGVADINGLVGEINPSFQLVLSFSPILEVQNPE